VGQIKLPKWANLSCQTQKLLSRNAVAKGAIADR
jgi:hypothetical protein